MKTSDAKIRINSRFKRYGIIWRLTPQRKRNPFDAKYILWCFTSDGWRIRAYPDTIEDARKWIHENRLYV